MVLSKHKSRADQRRRGAITARVALLCAVVGASVWIETRTSLVQATVLSSIGRKAQARLAPGSNAQRLPAPTGPYDVRLGYTGHSEHLAKLDEAGFEIVAQAAPTPMLRTLTSMGLTPPYAEKARAGLYIEDSRNERLFSSAEPVLIYEHFDEIPPLLVDTLLFIENRDLLRPTPNQNPAVEWPRLARATLEWGWSWFGNDSRVPGGSTLATQLEKLRHSPQGLTMGSGEKARQMASASLRAYIGGSNTIAARKRIVVDYLNSINLAAVAGHGEVIGVPMGLALWYGSDYRVVTDLINGDEADDMSLRAKAYAYRQALGLVLAAGRPHLFLIADREALALRTERFLAVLAAEGVISERLRDAAISARPEYHLKRQVPVSASPDERDDARPMRVQLMGTLGVDSLYELDRMDVSVRTSSIGLYEKEVQRLLDDVRNPDSFMNRRFRTRGVLDDTDPTPLTLSFSLYERTGDVNRLRIHADTKRSSRLVDDSVMLDLGSTAKLRTLATYLEMMTNLYATAALPERRIDKRDILARWARERRLARPDEPLIDFLWGAMNRHYSASPWEKFQTGRGFHRFANFNDEHDDKRFSIRNATRHSVNLPFVRLMQDIVAHLIYGVWSDRADILNDAGHPLRSEYLKRAASFETTQSLHRYYRLYKNRTPQEMRRSYFNAIRKTPRRVAVLIQLMHPDISLEQFTAEMREWMADMPRWELDDEALESMYYDYDPEKFTPRELAHLAGGDWLRLFTLRHLSTRPTGLFSEFLEEGKTQRALAFAWLHATSMKVAQDRRIYSELEVDAFAWLHAHWRDLGYPFARLVPSLATALGASADRPTALADLMGIIQASGLRHPTRRIEEIRLAADTPYDTVLVPRTEAPVRVMTPEVAEVLRGTLVEVVEHGTARRTGGAIPGPDGSLLAIGGKTGTGDHVKKTVDAYGTVVATSAVSRSAVFPFLIGDRFYGVVTAYVKGERAADYSFTSSLATEILHSLRLVLVSMTAEPAENHESHRISDRTSESIAARGI